jgi:hypothetical protein
MLGSISQYDIVDEFLKSTILDPIELGYIDESDLLKFLPRLNIIVTTAKSGAESIQANSVSELLFLLRKTTWIPFVTGEGVGKNVNILPDFSHQNDDGDDSDWFLDGGFSRVLHPKCEHTLYVPLNWQTTLHTLNPGMTHSDVTDMWRMGVDDSINKRRDWMFMP